MKLSRRQLQQREAPHQFARKPEQFVTGGEDTAGATADRSVRSRRSPVDHVLPVVDHHQGLPAPVAIDEGVQRTWSGSSAGSPITDTMCEHPGEVRPIVTDDWNLLRAQRDGTLPGSQGPSRSASRFAGASGCPLTVLTPWVIAAA